jgi:hypothetical protein
MVFFVVRYLSPQRIEYAKQFENNKLHFDINDTRENINTKFDGVFNLFTSFRYLDNDDDEIAILETIKNSIKSNSG